MALLEEIQNEAVDSKSDLGQLLRKCKVLASRLGSKPLEHWLLWESQRYPKGADLPAYRHWPLIIHGFFAGPFQSQLTTIVPAELIPEQYREKFTTLQCRASVAVVQEAIRNARDGTITCELGLLGLLLGEKTYRNMNCLQA